MKSYTVFLILATILFVLTSNAVDAKNTRILSAKSGSSKGKGGKSTKSVRSKGKGGKSSKSPSSKGKGGKSSKSPSSKGKGGKSSKSPSSKGKGKGKGKGNGSGGSTTVSNSGGSNTAFTPRPTPSPKVTALCNGVQIVSDGICDLANNIAACDFDAQDCIIYNRADKQAQDCVKKSIPKGDPLTFPEDETDRIGDGTCDAKYNNAQCKNDGGDCARRHLRY